MERKTEDLEKEVVALSGKMKAAAKKREDSPRSLTAIRLKLVDVYTQIWRIDEEFDEALQLLFDSGEEEL